MDDDKLDRTLRNLGFHFFVSCPPIGLLGGLALCWRPNISLDVLFTSQFIIQIRVRPGSDIADFLCYFVYGPTRWQDKVPLLASFSS